ncbi:uncharacterized protein LOC125653630 [Ostrea edulis]|uniref:uncharacterized protein LOC125653630 n=1 Tax=Ostrea edulis TaxID=37623 RepID=UPI0024AFC406|nr:uncharacterized protein LOC125653630 [Ostrea edulis]
MAIIFMRLQNFGNHNYSPCLKMASFSVMKAVVILCLASTISAVKWPQGTYTLVKPVTGCPPGWLEGWRFQDNENDYNANYINRNPHHYYGIYGTKPRDLKFSYCTKDAHDFNEGGNWPAGDYCIFRQGPSCPAGFDTGAVFWDDENTMNMNRYGGVLPDGNYNNDTYINFCCRNDGYWMNPIELPTTQPFFLLRHASHCQTVKGMTIIEIGVYFGNEINYNNDGAFGNHPYLFEVHGHQLFIGYCYYHP